MDRQPTATRKLGAIWGERLRCRRLALGLTQDQVARVTGVTQQAVGRFETGKDIPMDRTKVELARALGTTPAELFEWPPMEDLIAESQHRGAAA